MAIDGYEWLKMVIYIYIYNIMDYNILMVNHSYLHSHYMVIHG